MVAALLALSSCAPIQRPSTQDTYRNPAAWLGREVRVCGYIDHPSSISQRRQGGPSLSVLDRTDSIGPRRKAGQRYFCLEGTITWMGCETDPNVICADATRDHAITVTRVAEP